MSFAPLEWTSHPARTRPIAAVMAAACVAVLGVLVWQLVGDWLWGALAVVGLFLPLSRFFLPSRFRVSDIGIEAAYPFSLKSIGWIDIGCVYWRETRALLAKQDTRRARARGITLDFTGLADPARIELRRVASLLTPAEGWR
ncbi:MAG: hypothetical protein EXS03_09495 [Phycisphaerales bacterium]|nr:hypothetical protein [Phycisphaerales bacterium]